MADGSVRPYIVLDLVGVTGTGYYRSLPLYESDPYNFSTPPTSED